MPIRLPPALRGPAPSLLIAFALGAAGCEIFAGADRDLILASSGGNGGLGGASSATTIPGSGGTGGAASCLLPIDCPGADTDCTVRTCDDGACGTRTLPLGTPTT